MKMRTQEKTGFHNNTRWRSYSFVMQIQNKLSSNYLTSNRLNDVTLEVYSLSLHLERSDYILWNEVTIWWNKVTKGWYEVTVIPSNQGGANSVTLASWHTKSWPRMLVASKAVFLKNYLAVS